jgi:choice-of-anchor C domain-containing protein
MQSLVNPQSPTTLVLTFSQPMDLACAEDPANYRLVWAGRDHRLGTKDDRIIPIRWARYDAASQSVKLRLMHRQPQDRTLWLTVAGSSPGGLTNAAGTPLAGPGMAGSDGDHALHLDLKALRKPMRLGLLPDGGFETPRARPPDKGRTLTAGHRALAPWRITAGSVNVQTYWPAAEGTHSLDLNGTRAGTIEQTFATIPGQVYQLLFDYANNPDRPARTATATVTVTGAGALLSRVIAHRGSTPRHMNCTRFLGTFVADSASTTLRFTSTTPGAHGIVLDAVSVTAVPGVSDTTPP